MDSCQKIEPFVCKQTDIEKINLRIMKEICFDTIDQLKDENLMTEYNECFSVQQKKNKLQHILQGHEINQETIKNILDEYISDLIPPGTRGVIRGNKFNTIIRKHIESLQLNTDRFEICFEKHCHSSETSQRPDWYILDKENNRTIIGMNQLDLWSGGQQLNRGSYYIENTKYNNEDTKLLCVVCNKIQFQSKTKAYTLFEIGFNRNTLCYLKNLDNIIKSFFEL
jgi:hypothetical protein